MAFKKGVSGNPKGKPKGAKNKPVQEKIESLLRKNISRIECELDTASPKQRREFFIQLTAALSSNSSNITADART